MYEPPIVIVITPTDPDAAIATSSPEFEPQVLGMDPRQPQPVAIVKKTVLDLKQKKAQLTAESPLVVDADQIDSVTLRRLIREVRNDKKPGAPAMYNRIHNRHNRGPGHPPYPE